MYTTHLSSVVSRVGGLPRLRPAVGIGWVGVVTICALVADDELVGFSVGSRCCCVSAAAAERTCCYM